MAEEKDLKDLEAIEAEARAKAEAEAMTAKASADRQNLQETTDLMAAQGQESAALNTYNKAQYDNLGQIVSDVQGKINAAKQKDAVAQKRENAFRYISGLGDTLSSVANLVGTAHGASNQQQVYNSNIVAQKAEEARKARKIEMEDLNTRLDEMKARQNELKASGSLAEAQLKAKQNREMLELLAQQRTKAEEAKRYADTQTHTAMREARADWTADRAFKAQQEQFKAQQAQNKQAQENWQKNYNMQYAKFQDEQKAKNYNFTLANESIDIPKDKLNEVNVERIFQMLPEEIKKNIKGEQYTEIVPNEDPMMEPTRKTSYKAPSLAQKLAAIGAYADSDEAIRNELKRLAPVKGKSGRDWSNREE